MGFRVIKGLQVLYRGTIYIGLKRVDVAFFGVRSPIAKIQLEKNIENYMESGCSLWFVLCLVFCEWHLFTLFGFWVTVTYKKNGTWNKVIVLPGLRPLVLSTGYGVKG